ncbi:MAG: hypothetical protein JWO98_5502 [Frankiales bacterium]|nr:hypothetical protein [Frankiales bacterium]
MSDIYEQVSTTYPLTDDRIGEAPTSSGVGEKADEAKEQAGQLKDQVAASGGQVAGTAKAEAGKVASEAKVQAKDLLAQTQSELKDQAATQQKRVASGLRSVSEELGNMADSSSGGGVAADLVQQAATRAGSIAGWLEDRDPGSVLREVRSYASRKPGTFIAVAAIAGLVAGRLTKNLVSVASDEKADTPSAATTTATPAYTPTYVPTPPVPPTTAVETEPVINVSPEGASFDEQTIAGERADEYSGDRA